MFGFIFRLLRRKKYRDLIDLVRRDGLPGIRGAGRYEFTRNEIRATYVGEYHEFEANYLLKVDEEFTEIQIEGTEFSVRFEDHLNAKSMKVGLQEALRALHEPNYITLEIV